jgi:hypothetical protein
MKSKKTVTVLLSEEEIEHLKAVEHGENLA